MESNYIKWKANKLMENYLNKKHKARVKNHFYKMYKYKAQLEYLNKI